MSVNHQVSVDEHEILDKEKVFELFKVQQKIQMDNMKNMKDQMPQNQFSQD